MSRGPGLPTPDSKIAWATGFSFRQGKESALLGGPVRWNAHQAEHSPLFAQRARPTPLERKNEYLMFALGEETAVQAVVGSIVWRFASSKNQGIGR